MEKRDGGVIRDLIYFDEKKAASLLSQIEGGLPTISRETHDAAAALSRGTGLDLKVAKLSRDTTTTDRSSIEEDRVLHHAMLARIERWLTEGDLLAVVDEQTKSGEGNVEEVRSFIVQRSFASVTGLAIIQDFGELTTTISRFNQLVTFINRASRHALETSPEITSLRSQIAEFGKPIQGQRGSATQRANAKAAAREIQAQIEQAIAASVPLTELPAWLLDGFGLFLETFMRGRVELRLQPLRGAPSFELIANLKRDCFTDADISTIISSYGTRPDRPLCLIGFVTSAPVDEQVAEDSSRAERRGDGQFEKSFDHLFAALESIEEMVRTTRYPSVAVYPLAVFRRMR